MTMISNLKQTTMTSLAPFVLPRTRLRLYATTTVKQGGCVTSPTHKAPLLLEVHGHLAELVCMLLCSYDEVLFVRRLGDLINLLGQVPLGSVQLCCQLFVLLRLIQ